MTETEREKEGGRRRDGEKRRNREGEKARRTQAEREQLLCSSCRRREQEIVSMQLKYS